MAVFSYSTLYHQFKAISSVYPIMNNNHHADSPISKRIMKWAGEMLTKCMEVNLARSDAATNADDILNRKDGEALAQLTAYLPDPAKLLADLYDSELPSRWREF